MPSLDAAALVCSRRERPDSSSAGADARRGGPRHLVAATPSGNGDSGLGRLVDAGLVVAAATRPRRARRGVSSRRQSALARPRAPSIAVNPETVARCSNLRRRRPITAIPRPTASVSSCSMVPGLLTGVPTGAALRGSTTPAMPTLSILPGSSSTSTCRSCRGSTGALAAGRLTVRQPLLPLGSARRFRHRIRDLSAPRPRTPDRGTRRPIVGPRWRRSPRLTVTASRQACLYYAARRAPLGGGPRARRSTGVRPSKRAARYLGSSDLDGAFGAAVVLWGPPLRRRAEQPDTCSARVVLGSGPTVTQASPAGRGRARRRSARADR